MKLVVNNESKIGRNDPCPCGSGVKYKKCCWEREVNQEMTAALETQDRPDKLDPIAMRMEMQAMMGQIGKIIKEKGMSIEDANKYFTGRDMDEIATEARGFIRSPKEQAEDFAYQAHSAKTPKQRILLAQKALELDPNCAEAFIVLDANLSQDPVETIAFMQKATAAAKNSLGEKFFTENEGHFWGLHESRSYMRAQQFLAQALWDCRRQSEAIEICWDLLKLNPNDNQGIRYILFDYLLTDNRLDRIEKLQKMFPDDGTAHWEFNKAIYYFKTLGPQSEKAIEQLKIACKRNPFIEKYLTDKLKMPKESPSSYSIGSKEEALCYIQDSLGSWLNTPGAVEWMTAVNFKKSTSGKKKKTRKTDI
jgi:tetratricopeptide (TPR) repeat protein